jgi:hypothetical protein
LTVIAADEAKTEGLEGTYPVLGIIFTIEVIWAVCYTIWPKRSASPDRPVELRR